MDSVVEVDYIYMENIYFISDNGQNINSVSFLVLLCILFEVRFSKDTIINKILFQSPKYFFAG